MKRTDDIGFSLVEVLVVIVILSVLALIALPSLFENRTAAARATVRSDLRNVGNVVESFRADNQSYAGFDSDPSFTGYRASPDVTLTAGGVGGTWFCVEATHPLLETGETWSLRSNRPVHLDDSPC